MGRGMDAAEHPAMPRKAYHKEVPGPHVYGTKTGRPCRAPHTPEVGGQGPQCREQWSFWTSPHLPSLPMFEDSPVCSSRGCLPVQKQKVKCGTHSVPASQALAKARDLTPSLDHDARSQGLCRCHSDGGDGSSGGSSYNLFPEATAVAVLEAASSVGGADGTS